MKKVHSCPKRSHQAASGVGISRQGVVGRICGYGHSGCRTEAVAAASSGSGSRVVQAVACLMAIFTTVEAKPSFQAACTLF